ncbi:invasion protein IalB [Sphingomonas naasensis]|uniref:Invasion associated locus B family protein n=1 Tax=Sphingomonas naasensis TaxID=1344951 RepID=A0A4S1WJE7_9SPHN|nr:invasion associated locus B family protein [Sphingomonas naasensis]NIJ20932.1 invasion protein IalB [Sphingomonas naasensis]TGX43321.1 invasion associated locus B family protein [Sphingomonas naasensis]
METIAALLAAGASWMAIAQQAQTAPAAPAAAPAAQAAGPAWQLVCSPAPAASGTPATAPAASQPCSLVQNLLAGEQKQRLLTVILQRTPQAGHNMTIALPHGVLFPAGVSLQVDEAATKPLAVQTSDQNGAYTGTPVDAVLLGALRAGKTLKIGFTAGNGQRIVVPVTLRDFPTGLAALDKSPLPPSPRPAAPATPAPASPPR